MSAGAGGIRSARTLIAVGFHDILESRCCNCNAVELRSDLHAQRAAAWSLRRHFRDFAVRQYEFPVPANRESIAAPAERLVSSGAGFSAGDTYGRTLLYFPYRSGNCRRAKFARDCSHRHLVSTCRDFGLVLGRGSGKQRDSAGCWRSGGRASEPETANSGPG